MANNLSKEKQVAVIAALAEGKGIGSIERMTGIHRDTIMRLGLKVGTGCAQMLDETMRGLSSTHVEVDEIWEFIGKKKKNLMPDDPAEFGDCWTFVAIDADTKVVPCHRVGKRDGPNALAFIDDLAGRMRNRIQLSADALRAYVEAIDTVFTRDGIDFAQIVKTYSAPSAVPVASSRYSPGEVVSVSKVTVFGRPNPEKISTSYVERQNLTLRMHCRRLTRLTLAFSKKLDNFKAAVALNFAYYNFVLRHASLRMTPAMAAGVTNDFGTVADLVESA
jgi:IS1 family transposase